VTSRLRFVPVLALVLATPAVAYGKPAPKHAPPPKAAPAPKPAPPPKPVPVFSKKPAPHMKSAHGDAVAAVQG
jgi:hypothetical protein